jgi:hypothetical protein
VVSNLLYMFSPSSYDMDWLDLAIWGPQPMAEERDLVFFFLACSLTSDGCPL